MSEILFADDDAGLREMVAEVLRAGGHRVRLATNGTQALAEVRADAPDLVILDYRMGTPDGFAVCREIKSDLRIAHLPVLILTAQSDIEDRLRGFDAGADDYLHKPFDPRELLARVSALLRLAQRGLDRNPTTGLPGGEAIHHEIERRRGEGKPFAVCYFDLDHFKPFADHFGFAVADAAIRAAGEAVTGVGGEAGAFVGHVGGDDFVLLCAPEDARQLAEKVTERFRRALPGHLPDGAVSAGSYRGRDRYGVEREFPITRLSAAVVHIDPAHWSSLEALGELVADVKHRAKQDGTVGIAEVQMAG
jgi:PleD family two-component response regulator